MDGRKMMTHNITNVDGHTAVHSFAGAYSSIFYFAAEVCKKLGQYAILNVKNFNVLALEAKEYSTGKGTPSVFSRDGSMHHIIEPGSLSSGMIEFSVTISCDSSAVKNPNNFFTFATDSTFATKYYIPLEDLGYTRKGLNVSTYLLYRKTFDKMLEAMQKASRESMLIDKVDIDDGEFAMLVFCNRVTTKETSRMPLNPIETKHIPQIGEKKEREDGLL